MARLLGAEQVARTTDLEVAHRDLEAGAELRVFADGFEALFCDLGENLALAERQIGVGVPARTADAAAQLMQLREAKLVGVLDNEGVDVRDVDAGFDNRRADENLNVAVREGLHHVAEPFLAHFAVRHGDGDVLAELGLELRGAFVNCLDAVVQVIDLPAAREFPPDGLEDDLIVVFEDEGLDRVAVLRRLFDRGHIAQTREGHIERARDGRCG